MLDEAHLLTPDMLHEIRFILNFHIDSASPISLVLVGQPELRGKLKMLTFEALAQRVQVRFHLSWDSRIINACCVSCLLDACARGHKVVTRPAYGGLPVSEFDEAERATSGW